MERLNTDRMEEFKNRALKLYNDSIALIDEEDPAYCAAELAPRELLMRKMRLVTCIKLLSEFGFAKGLENLDFPDIEKMYMLNEIGKRGYYLLETVEWSDYLSSCTEIYSDLGEQYLKCALKNTDWEIYYITEIDEYNQLPEEVILKIQDLIEQHWDAENIYCGENIQNEYLTSLGISASGYEEFYPLYNLLLLNKKIERAYKLCKTNKHCKKWREYKTLNRISSFCLLDRYFPFISCKDLKSSEGVCVSYLMGEIFGDRVEEVGMYQLNYEVVLLLLIADMLAENILKRYQKEVEEQGSKK